MRVDDAPPAGWYPDPEGYSRLRWWEGTDWSDRFRAPPTPSEFDLADQLYDDAAESPAERHRVSGRPGSGYGSMSRQDSEALIQQVRMAAREEAERAAALFGQQARAVTRSITPLISEYTGRVMRWVRILSVIAVVLLVGWLAFQLFAQVSLFEWIGDRVDNIGDGSGVPPPMR
ncbi:MAG TPA: DUF2510 domain-containing protein [Ilumatobacter sp.]